MAKYQKDLAQLEYAQDKDEGLLFSVELVDVMKSVSVCTILLISLVMFVVSAPPYLH